MIQKKVCLLGSFAVGKTSLVSRFVSSVFSEKYLSTVGVKVDKKVMAVGDRQLTLVLWDIYGQDRFQTVQPAYLQGASGYILVADGTRFETLEVARDLQKIAIGVAGDVPCVLALNKADLVSEWQIDEKALVRIANAGWPVHRTSAKTGAGVEDVFSSLAQAMLEHQ
jgi:small GTP-binding protein